MDPWYEAATLEWNATEKGEVVTDPELLKRIKASPKLRAITFDRQRVLPVMSKGVHLDCGYRLDFLVEQAVVVELKAVELLLPIHEAQMLTYLRLGGWSVGLPINFNVPALRRGLKRIVHNFKETSAPSAPLR